MKNLPIKSNKRWMMLQEDRVLIFDVHLFMEGDLPKLFEHKIIRCFKVGELDGFEYFCAEIAANDLPENYHQLTLRQAITLSQEAYFSILVKGYSIIRWDKNHRFCGQCARETIIMANSFERQCSYCQMSYYPRISPSIIVLIQRNDQVLMARGVNFLPGVYGLIAGFVEVGETLEEAVHREVYEEIGIKIKKLSYFGSQPWPFPDSLVIGFTAEYESGEIVMDKHEIEDAGWYRYDNLPGLPSMPISIAFDMIQQFIKTQIK